MLEQVEVLLFDIISVLYRDKNHGFKRLASNHRKLDIRIWYETKGVQKAINAWNLRYRDLRPDAAIWINGRRSRM